ncbi:hypothetical protein [Komagataeibacter swingsii]|uniref:EF-hand domain-containing protein n=1 Tax=Komagataeibacter swingsii TaxID=215220 RepID=A0A2V4RM07_9PROT|nr:hypothetical protein [Komagataeibacter swingsii]PYD68572.1 hypothetical protein CFR76_14435 [Komagataeibacter swingsii]GBQ57388.1 hypothetical protein AA16373_0995 [Komagataeibacter swingsii DSM 16373]
MKYSTAMLLAAAMLAATCGPAGAHRLDEYLQATVIDVTRQHIAVTLRLTPGVDVASTVIHQIDSNGDGILSPQEQQAYVARVRQGVSFSINGKPVSLNSVASVFPSVTALRTGSGVISLHFRIMTSLAPGSYRLAYANRGMGPDTVYLVNGLLPHDPAIHVERQERSVNQSTYALDFTVQP